MSKAKEFLRVHASQLVMPRNAPRRRDLGDMPALKNALLARGVDEPLGVQKLDDQTFSVIAGLGYRRFLAINELIGEGYEHKFKRIPVYIYQDLSPIDEPLLLLGSDVHEALPVEMKAAAISELLEHGLPLAEVAILSGYGIGDLKKIIADGGHFELPDLSASVLNHPPFAVSVQQRLDELMTALGNHNVPQRRFVGEAIALIGGFLSGQTGAGDAAVRLLNLQPELST